MTRPAASDTAEAAGPATAAPVGLGTRALRLWAAAVGLVAAAVTLAIAEVVAFLFVPGSSPLFAVGSLIVDLAPSAVKDAVIGLFGTADKAVLLTLLALVLVLLAALIGNIEFRRPPWGTVALALVGGVAIVAVTTRGDANSFWAVPTVLGMLGGVVALRTLSARLHRWDDAITSVSSRRGVAASARPVLVDARVGASRRSFLIAAGLTAAAAAVAGFGARALQAGRAAANSVREALSLPTPADPAAAIPAGADLDVDGITPLFTQNATFYRVDTALQVPSVDPADWKLRITGMVENEIEIDFEELLALPLTERAITLACVSNNVGGDLIGNALWLGYPIHDLLARAKPVPGADMVLSRSVDGWTASTPLDVLQDEKRDSLLAVGMNGTPLPLEHGFPVRMVVPGLYGFVSATKWVVEMKLTRFADETAYWSTRGWSERGPIKTSSRIDVPRRGQGLGPGKVVVAGVAWAQHTGIERVEVQVDDGAWAETTLADPISTDTWRQWVWDWNATPGQHTLRVRATDAAGMTQNQQPRPVAPDGSEGWDERTIRIG